MWHTETRNTGDVHNPHTPRPRISHRFCAGTQQLSGTDSSPLYCSILYCNYTLFPAQSYGAVYQQFTSSSSWSRQL